MVWPEPSYGHNSAAYDKLSGTFKPQVDPKLWPALMARSPLLSYVPRGTVNGTKYDWEIAVEPTRLYTEASSTDTTIDSSGAATNNVVVFSSGTGLEAGMLIRNVTRATPIGTYGADEILQITAVSTATCTTKRDYAAQNSGTGSAVHATGDVFEVIATPKEEGSSPGANKYIDVTLTSNYTQNFDFEIEVTGDQMASERMVVADTVNAQVSMGMQKLQNELESTLLYGALNGSANAGSDSYVRSTKGLQNFLYASGSNVDYSTKAVTEAALNSRFDAIVADKTDPMDKFIIVAHPTNARTISHFGEDVVRVTQDSTKWGRSISTFKSDLGIEADVIWTLNCSKSDLFIIDLNKIELVEFRPWQTATRNFQLDGVDAFRQRVLGAYGVKVVDPLYSHAALSYITW